MNIVPSVTVDQMREVDRIMVEEIRVSILMMMENASRNIADFARSMVGGNIANKKIIILCGKGNNGGDGLGAARHLINFGANVEIFLVSRMTELRPDPKVQYSVLKNIHANVYHYDDSMRQLVKKAISQSDLIIDALLGYNLKGNPKEPIANLIHTANDADKLILAVDIPSGLDGDTGQPHKPTIKATATLTLALPKVGLLTEVAKKYVGKLCVADLSVPSVVYKKLGITIPRVFETEEIVKVL